VTPSGKQVALVEGKSKTLSTMCLHEADLKEFGMWRKTDWKKLFFASMVYSTYDSRPGSTLEKSSVPSAYATPPWHVVWLSSEDGRHIAGRTSVPDREHMWMCVPDTGNDTSH